MVSLEKVGRLDPPFIELRTHKHTNIYIYILMRFVEVCQSGILYNLGIAIVVPAVLLYLKNDLEPTWLAASIHSGSRIADPCRKAQS